jgi:hypothetical protein
MTVLATKRANSERSRAAHTAADRKEASTMDGSNLIFIVTPIIIPICGSEIPAANEA